MLVALALFGLMCLNYGLNTLSFRFVARNHYPGVAMTDAVIAAFGFLMIGEVSHSQALLPFFGYVLGGVVGSVSGLWLSQRLERK